MPQFKARVSEIGSFYEMYVIKLPWSKCFKILTESIFRKDLKEQ